MDGRYYREVLLKKQMLPVMHRIVGDTYVFQQDSALAHCARETVQLLQQEMLQFISLICGLLTVRPKPGRLPDLGLDARARVQDARPGHQRLEAAPY